MNTEYSVMTNFPSPPRPDREYLTLSPFLAIPLDVYVSFLILFLFGFVADSRQFKMSAMGHIGFLCWG